jgi:hypothetical protein
MSTLKMEFYKQGVRFLWPWRNERDYLAGKAFLENLLGYPAMEAGELDFFCFEHQQQFDALIRFQQQLEQDGD